MENCQICASSDWISLPDPIENQSVTTAGRIIQQNLGKSQCSKCGFVQRVRAEYLGFTDYYEQDYANYYNRPGTDIFHKRRYKAIIDWMGEFILDEFEFETVLDVGCGQGWAMDAFLNKYPNKKISGIEPSHYNVEIAKDKGFDVFLGKMEEMTSDQKYDLIFSNNVIQHVNDARAFLKDLKHRLNENGLIIVTCPDGSKPNIELLWADQNYSFLSNHLLELGRELGFQTLIMQQSLEDNALPPAQLLLLTNNKLYENQFRTKDSEMVVNIEEILKLRKEYLNSFGKINEFITSQIPVGANVYNLGASYWTSVLAAYCPDYWNKVNACVIDNNDDEYSEFFGKKLMDIKDIQKSNSVLALGISPASQEQAKIALNDWKKVINWNEFINY